MTTTQTNLNIRSLLESCGYKIYSIRKTKIMVGGQRYNFHGGLRQGFCKGTPSWFYRVELLSDGTDTEVEYKKAAAILRDGGHTTARYGYKGLNMGLTVDICNGRWGT